MGFLYPDIQQQYNEADKADLMELFAGIEWQAMLSGRVDITKQLSTERVDTMFAKWRSLACKITGLSIGSIATLTNYHGLHVHALLVGANRCGMTINDVDADTLQRCWFGMFGGTCRISHVYDSGAAEYIINKNLVHKYATVLSPRGMPLLNKLRKAGGKQYEDSTCY